MPQGILDILGGGIAGPGKGAKGCHIGENPSSEVARIVGYRLTLNDLPCCLQKVTGKVEAGSKIIGRTGGNISNRCFGACLEQPRNGLIKCAVATAADDQVHLIAKSGNLTDGIAGTGSNIGLHGIVRTVKQRDDLCQHFCCFLLPGIWIHDQKHFFHGYFLSLCDPGAARMFSYLLIITHFPRLASSQRSVRKNVTNDRFHTFPPLHLSLFRGILILCFNGK